MSTHRYTIQAVIYPGTYLCLNSVASQVTKLSILKSLTRVQRVRFSIKQAATSRKKN